MKRINHVHVLVFHLCVMSGMNELTGLLLVPVPEL